MTEEKILQFLRIHGPSVPTKVAKFLNISILFASAHLSELVSRRKVKVSHLKVGGSPLYYLPQHEAQVSTFARNNLNSKDVAVMERLQAEGVLREGEQDLLTKVALRSLKDFAVPLQVDFQGSSELFWRWHMASPEEAQKKIAVQMGAGGESPRIEVPEVQSSLLPLPSPEISLAPALSIFSSPHSSSLSSPSPVSASFPLPQTQFSRESSSPTEEMFKPLKKRQPVEDTLFPEVEDLLKRLKITIEQKETLRKNAEMNLLLKVPSVVGSMTYFCKAKQKGKCDEKDLSAAYMEAQMKKLPLLFLYTGELTKKAQEMLDSGAFENVIVKKVD